MKRICEIIANIRERYPKDDFFNDFEKTYRISESKRKAYQAYDRVLNQLDIQSWQVLKEKSLRHYCDHRRGQKKQGFFNQLNEAFAYDYLMRQGCNNIKFLEEDDDGTKKPDLEYVYKGYCEVKSLGISKEEIARRESIDVINGQVYFNLTNGFLNKFHKAICSAWKQINVMGKEGIVYVLIKFDDIALDNYKNYRRQLINYSRQHKLHRVFIKIGYLDKKRISIKLPFS